MAHPDAIFLEKAILVSHLRYKDRSSALYWNTHVRAEWRALSALGRFVRYHFMCAFNVTEVGHDRCLVCILVVYDVLQAQHGFKLEKEPVSSYKSRTMILNRESGIWVVAYVELVLRLFAAVLITVYG